MTYLLVTAICYTVCTLLDKYSISKYDLTGNDFTFLIAASSCVFMLPALFITKITFEISAKTLLIIALLTIDKIAEFVTSAAVLRKLSGFETKVWLGTAMFLSYFSDIAFWNEKFEIVKLIFIIIVCICLAVMVRDGQSKDKGRYCGIKLLILLYVLSKYFYGVIIRASSELISPNLGVYSAMVIIAVIYFFKADIHGIADGKRTGSVIVFLVRIPNVVGLICENILIGKSLTMYSMEQPVILSLLLIYSLIRRESTSKIGLVSGIVCLISVFAFKLL